ncbi:hypothetical protein [Novosphingobium colocasiae]|uniref:Uncharacterized protein n=1 Tax=Novosphingobium colocasiae TaxID=1256513 RepID=A0A918P938_9SPHN|nr:hypothetical protein [Novosphingobium colocasiae]GGY91659.1 hypothetical protein GCM10011614_02960 [Novosphingobium colocasiae]
MIPSLADRISSMQRALHNVIIPAIAPDNGLAMEQAHLMLAHLGLIAEQADYTELYEAAELVALERLATALAQAAGGGAQTIAAAATLRAELENRGTADAGARRTRTVALSGLVERLVDASGTDGDADFLAVSHDLIIADNRLSSKRDRAWFRSTGFETGDVALPSLATMFTPAQF